ncbi:hypothetical protein F441_01152 [Phytophthora nicotianae CJ01A1]|uniref:Uncharacterized protein n=1 Tax=Phytophthora nicotianae CJ01A1 TaxID=1317063 RepID=W2XU58_PHYNI|nr:hypothetical protein F441_01152 [Phytophthora nicotianae CJ01A1]
MSPPLHRGDQSELCAYPLVVTASSVEAVSHNLYVSKDRRFKTTVWTMRRRSVDLLDVCNDRYTKSEYCTNAE